MLMQSRHPVAARRGFTLIEVMLVAAILLILAGVATVAVQGYMAQAKRNEARMKMQKVKTAAEAFQLENDRWPELIELYQPSPGNTPRLPGGQDDATDPWGKPFVLQVVPDVSGNERMIVKSTGSGEEIVWPKS